MREMLTEGRQAGDFVVKNVKISNERKCMERLLATSDRLLFTS